MTDAQREIISLLQQIKAASGGGGGTAWGDITGTLSNQTDLQTELDGKASLAQAAHSGGVLGISRIAMNGAGAVVPDFATGILGGGTTYSSTAAGRVIVTFASAQADTNYTVAVLSLSDGFAKLNGKTTADFELRGFEFTLAELAMTCEIAVLRLSQ